MSNIRIDLEATVINGQTLTFKSPVDCSQITGLILYYPEGNTTKSTVFQFADAHGNNVGNINLFAENVLVKVILDTDLKRAYVQNADTNAYLENRFANLNASDVGARPNTWMPTAEEVGARPNTWMPSANDVGARPNTWTPSAADVGARPNTWTPSASDVGALPTAGGTVNGPVNINGTVTMKGNVSYSGGDINMNSRKIWNLATPTGSGDAATKVYVDEGLAKKAPAGFGLGGNGQFLDSGTNFDDVTGSGFYSWNNGCINSPFDWGTMIAVSRHGGPVQLALGHDGEARDQIAIRSLSNGTSNWQYLMKRFNLLWQNASPNSLFGAQTISVDLSAYDTVLITYNQYYENHNVAMCFVPKFCFGQLETVMTGGRYRTLLVSNDGVSFNDQLLADGSAGSNNFCIPAQIFGCKLS